VSTEDEKRLSELEGRVRHLEDLEEIRRLFLDYGTYLDTKDFESLSRLWAEQGEITLPVGAVKGPDGVLGVMKSMLGKDLAVEPGKDLHIFTNQVVDIDGDRATATSFWAYITPDRDGHPRIAQFGHYEDELIRVDGKWQFGRRSGFRDIGVPGAGVPGVST
jgi:hypothetical protein